MKILQINKGFLLIGLTIIFVLLLVTFLPFVQASYSSQPNTGFETILIKIFVFITFPTGYALDNWPLVANNTLLNIIILLVNIFIYGLVIERILSIIINRIKNK